jgi:Ser/Thr protein kinase RdoA (MazF antagonist)
VRLIDFSFCAIGDYLFDLVIALSDLQPALHPALLEGYQSIRSLPEGYQQLMQAFFIGMMAGAFNYLAARPETQPILNRKVPQVAGQARRFLQGEWFWFCSEQPQG